MLKKYSQVFKGLFYFIDLLVIFAAWILSYYLRFYASLIPVFYGLPDFKQHLFLSLLILPVYAIVFRTIGLYESLRLRQTKWELFNIFKASSLSLLIVIFIIYFFKKGFHYSRLTFLCFWVLNILALFFFRGIIREILRALRRRGYNLRHILIVGTDRLAREVAQKINRHLEFGLNIVGFLGRKPEQVGEGIDGIKVLATYADIKNIISEKGIDEVIIALPFEEEKLMRTILGSISNEMVDIKVVPDLSQFFTLRKGVEELDGLPIINLRESPLYGWNGVIKRLFDIIGSFIAIMVFSPLMLFIIIVMKFTSPGPIFYKQKRMSLDGRSFDILKFRSMRVNAEEETGAVWTKENDPRRTRLGVFLRRTSLDELPQFFSVLRGEMSLVGPRPERPVLVEQFRQHIPRYMLRHKIKAGMTGWAQVHGWRGNTSLEKRIEYDLYYIENWSLWLDLKIILKTIPAVLKGKGA
ncbi:MAG: undecaprenyl-phosphate glucose phosphotransferase, partial [Candidatus Omnitrophica bacterium]|nr:undecaprenyl-phosphate glucose phosphotransferase [Candidatus Omnitrophota bacterium]